MTPVLETFETDLRKIIGRVSEAKSKTERLLPPSFADPRISGRFEALPELLRRPLLRLRQTIFDVAEGLPRLGGLVETLKWNDPGYHPVKARVGTTIRINAHRGSGQYYALYVPCQTSLVAMIRLHYPSVFTIEGKRALLFEAGTELPADPLRHCIAMALTYHLPTRVET